MTKLPYKILCQKQRIFQQVFYHLENLISSYLSSAACQLHFVSYFYLENHRKKFYHPSVNKGEIMTLLQLQDLTYRYKNTAEAVLYKNQLRF